MLNFPSLSIKGSSTQESL